MTLNENVNISQQKLRTISLINRVFCYVRFGNKSSWIQGFLVDSHPIHPKSKSVFFFYVSCTQVSFQFGNINE